MRDYLTDREERLFQRAMCPGFVVRVLVTWCRFRGGSFVVLRASRS